MFGVWLALLGQAAVAASGPLTVPVVVDTESRTVRIGDRVEHFMTPQLSVLATDKVVRVLPSAGGSELPKRWFLRLQVHGADEAPSEFRAGIRTGRGRPPMYIDLDLPPLAAGRFYVAQLEFRGHQGEAWSSKRVLPIPGRRRVTRKWLGRIRDRASPDDLAALLPDVKASLRVEGTFIEVRGHWSPGPTADADAKKMAQGIAEALRSAGIPAARLKIRVLGATELRFPTLTRSMARRNRRVELVRMPAPVFSATQLSSSEIRSRQLVIKIDGHDAIVGLKDAASREFSIDLDPPAQIHLELHDGRGAHAVERHGFALGRPLLKSRAATRLRRDDVHIVGGQMMLSPQGPELTVEMVAPDSVTAWLVTVQGTEYADVTAQAGGAGCPPPRLALTLTASVAQRQDLQVILHTQSAEGRRNRTLPIALPRLAAAPPPAHSGAGENPRSAFGELLDALMLRPAAQLQVFVHGGRRQSRKRARAQLEAAAARRGVESGRLRWSAGRALGGLVLQGHLFESAPLVVPQHAVDAQ